MIFLILISFLCWWYVTSYLFETGFALAMHLSGWVLMLLLYAFARLGILEFGYVVTLIVGPLALAAIAFRARQAGKLTGLSRNSVLTAVKDNRGSLISLAICFVILLMFALRVFNGFEFYGWDEFSHWAFATKVLVGTDALPTTGSFLNFPDYPPGVTLYHYFFLNGIPYSEPSLVFANFLLLFSGIVALARGVSKRPVIFLVVLAVISSLVFSLGYDFYQMYADLSLGIVFGLTLTVILFELPEKNRTSYSLPILLAALVLLKPIGIVYALIALGAIFLILTTRFFSEIKLSRPLKEAWPTLKQYQVFGISLVSIIFTFFDWRAHLNLGVKTSKLGVGTEVISETSLGDLWTFIVAPSSERHQNIWAVFDERYFSVVRKQSNFQGFKLDFSWMGFGDAVILPPFAFFVCLVSLTLIVSWLYRHENIIGVILVLLCVVAGYALNILVLMLTYGFIMLSPAEAALASFERYLNTYSFAWSALLIAMLARLAVKQEKTLFIASSIAFFIALLLGRPANAYEALVQNVQDRPVRGVNMRLNNQKKFSQARAKISRYADLIRDNHEDGQKVYLVSQDDAGFPKYVVTYELENIRVNQTCWSLAPKYRSGDAWSCDDILAKKIKGYSLVYLENVDDVFWERNAQFFNPDVVGRTDGLFRVINLEKSVRFEEIK